MDIKCPNWNLYTLLLLSHSQSLHYFFFSDNQSLTERIADRIGFRGRGRGRGQRGHINNRGRRGSHTYRSRDGYNNNTHGRSGTPTNTPQWYQVTVSIDMRGLPYT